MDMFVTTAGRTDERMIGIAQAVAAELQVDYVPRDKKAIQLLQSDQNSDCIVVGKQRLELYQMGESQPFFFHPNSATFRIKRLMKGEQDPFAEAARLTEGMSIVDCTLGLASDAIVASFLVGASGTVVGVEGQKYLAFLVKEGLEKWDPDFLRMREAMERIKIVQQHSMDYLASLSSGSVDCVYFDPMFEENILESDGIKALGKFALYEEFNGEMITEALRVARKRVILKDHYKSARFEKFGFQVFKRKSAKFHFGVIEKTD